METVTARIVDGVTEEVGVGPIGVREGTVKSGKEVGGESGRVMG